MWFLDGLDEITDQAERYRCASAIGEWFRTKGKNDRLILTTRPHAVQQSRILKALGIRQTVARVLPLEAGNQQQFLERWFAAVYGQTTSEKVTRTYKALWQSLERNTRLAKLKENPLLLSVIATIYHQGKQLPERRADLYRKAVDILLERRFGAVAGGNPALVRKMRQGLMSVARQMHEHGQIREIKDGDFMKFLVQGFFGDREILGNDKLELQEHMEKLGFHSGLLTMVGDPPTYSFYHLGFQEYLAARSYAEEREPFKKVEAYLDNGNWEEVILLTAGHLFETSVGCLGEDFLKELLKRVHGAPKLRNRLLLCLHAAVEAPESMIPDKLLGKIRKCTIDAFEDHRVPLKERAEIGMLLGKIGDPRVGVHVHNRWVRIPPGKFQMGSTKLDEKLEDFLKKAAQPIHEVHLTKEYWLGAFPVTNSEYQAFIENQGYETQEFWSKDGWAWLTMSEAEFQSWFEFNKKKYSLLEEWKEFFQQEKEPHFWNNSKFNGKNNPVVGISWFEAAAYCRWLTMHLRKEENRPEWWKERMQVSLPTEAQWEYAARSSKNNIYPWGNENPSEKHANFGEKLSATSAVGIFPEGRTETSLYDLAGNVWEWCFDVWDEEAYSQRENGIEDPFGNSGDKNIRLVRGGSWADPSSYLAAAIRNWFGAWGRNQRLGFRCCVAAAEHD